MIKVQKWVTILLVIFASGCKSDEGIINDGTLAGVINEYRNDNGLSIITVSESLTRVAQAHVDDLAANYSFDTDCNLHSWSDKGTWSACCYTPDQSQAACMWDKPRELTSYKGDGFEIAAFKSSGITAEEALEVWKASEPHHNVIMNRDIWTNTEWKAIGAAINGGFAVVWFGKESDQ